MNVADLIRALPHELASRPYINRLDVLDQSVSLFKVRLYIYPELFIQIYRNDRFDTTNMVLIYNGQRLYGRDQLDGVWHRHTAAAPEHHDHSAEARRPVNLSEFLDEVESVLSEAGLP